jgi:hypothetical protein
MPTYRYIDDFTPGDTYRVLRQIDAVASGIVTEAWFTVKTNVTDNDSMAKVNLHITTTPAASGYVVNNLDGTTDLSFIVQPTDSYLMSPLLTFYYDIVVKTSSAEIYTVEEGRLFTTRYIRQVP